jgi:anti-sigma regulatory factor (Ser/Thr protein kinase)
LAGFVVRRRHHHLKLPTQLQAAAGLVGLHDMGGWDMDLTLFPTLQASGEARRELSPMADGMDQGSFSDLKLLVGELVKISVAHGASEPIDMHLELVDREVRGVFDDHGPATRAMVRAREGKDDSLVLRLIDGTVDDWGTDRGQTRIWFRMGVRPRAGWVFPHS